MYILFLINDKNINDTLECGNRQNALSVSKVLFFIRT